MIKHLICAEHQELTMQSRRQILQGGLGLFSAGALAPMLGAAEGLASWHAIMSAQSKTGLSGPELASLKASRPLAPRNFDPEPRMIGGFPFKSWFEGDDFKEDIPFHTQQNDFPGGKPPKPTEEIDVCVIGG